MSKLKVYAWSKPGVNNFGDEMGPDLLRKMGHTVERVGVHSAGVVTIGSVMHHMAAAPKGCVVAGAGVMHIHNLKIDASHLDIQLIRGTLTQESLDFGDMSDQIWPAFGDPAILASTYYVGSARKPYKVGWVPHYVDDRKLPSADVTIDVLRPVEEVVYEITKCNYILTSSLHALIVAQSFGIPAQRLAHPRVLGGDIKWVDYATGYAQSDTGTIESILRGL
jgi:pyruvyltransferase